MWAENNKYTQNDRNRIIRAFREDHDWKWSFSPVSNLCIILRTAYEWPTKDQEFPKRKGGAISKKTPVAIQKIIFWISEVLDKLSSRF